MGALAASFIRPKSACPCLVEVLENRTRQGTPTSYTFASCDSYQETSLLLQTMVLLVNLINASRTHWFVVNCSRFCVGLGYDSMLLTTHGETSSISINLVAPMRSTMVTSFKYLPADLNDRLQMNKVVISISLDPIGRTTDGKGIWPLGCLQIERRRIRSKYINTTCSDKFPLPRPNAGTRVAKSSRANINFFYSYTAQTKST